MGQVAKVAVAAWIDDYAPSMGAALSYYTVFSLAPLLLIVVSIAGLVFGRQAAEGGLFGQLAGVVGPEAARLIQSAVLKASQTRGGVVGTVVGVVVLLAGATGVVIE